MESKKTLYVQRILLDFILQEFLVLFAQRFDVGKLCYEEKVRMLRAFHSLYGDDGGRLY